MSQQNVLSLANKKSSTKYSAPDQDKSKALDAALGQIERAFGKGSVMRLGDREQVVEAETVSTGSLGLDIALGIGGLPRGRVVEIYGPESSGKTTLALHVVAEAQKAGGTCAFVDAEHALDPTYAKKLGCDVEELLISQPDAGEQALDVGAHGAGINAAVLHPDLVIGPDVHQDAGGVRGVRLVLVGPVHFDPRLLDEGSDHDEEDEHDKDHVQHGREVDIRLLFCLLVFTESAH